MNSQTGIYNLKNKGQIIITDDTVNEDGSVTINYSLNYKALEECAKEFEKDVKELTKSEIHNFTMRNIGQALNCHQGWKITKAS